MLAATILLGSITAQLFGRRAAFFVSALFALLGTTLQLGVFATYDAMSVFLVALAAWCVIRPGARGPATGWMLAGAGVLALSNATAYTTLLFDPLIAVLALLTSPWTSWGLLAARRGPGPSWPGRLRCWASPWPSAEAATSAGSNGRC